MATWFKHPEIEEGTISRGNGIYKIRGGVFKASGREDVEAFREQGYQEIPEPEKAGGVQKPEGASKPEGGTENQGNADRPKDTEKSNDAK